MKPIQLSAALSAITLGGIAAALSFQPPAEAQQGATRRAMPSVAGPLTVVELFQSQGCSSCPPAAANINALANDPRVLALSYGVTYWDQLGWKDTFASPQFTARQWDYARQRGRGRVWTPQVYVGGQSDVVGANRAQLDQLIARTATRGPSVRIRDGRAEIGAGRAARPATVWMVRYDPRTIQVPIRAGENGGRTLPHRNTVRELVSLGQWSGKVATFTLPVRRDGNRVAVFLQDGKGGAIIGAARA